MLLAGDSLRSPPLVARFWGAFGCRRWLTRPRRPSLRASRSGPGSTPCRHPQGFKKERGQASLQIVLQRRSVMVGPAPAGWLGDRGRLLEGLGSLLPGF